MHDVRCDYIAATVLNHPPPIKSAAVRDRGRDYRKKQKIKKEDMRIRTCELKKYKKMWVRTGYIDGKAIDKTYYVFSQNGVAFQKSFKIGTGKIES